jgi:hypothetical protein
MLHKLSTETLFRKFFSPEEQGDKENWAPNPEKKEEEKRTPQQIRADERLAEADFKWQYANNLNTWLDKLGSAEDPEDVREMTKIRAHAKKLQEDALRLKAWWQLWNLRAETQVAQAQIPWSSRVQSDVQTQGSEAPNNWTAENEQEQKEQQKRAFLLQNKTPSERLKTLWTDPNSIEAWKPLGLAIDKIPEWVSPAQVIPESVRSLQVGDKVYRRVNNSRSWEFRSEDGQILWTQQLKEAKIGTTRTGDDLKKLGEWEKKWLEKYKDLEKYIAQRAREKGINQDVFIEAMKKELAASAYGETPKDIEEAKKDTWSREGIDRNIDALALKLAWDAEALKGGDISAFMNIAGKIDPYDQSGFARQALIKSWQTPAQAEWNIFQYIKNLLAPNGVHGRTFSNYREAASWQNSMVSGQKAWELGSLSAEFESGAKWPMAINGNDNGKPSFGTYQLRADALKQFADQLWIKWNHEELWDSTEFAQNWKKKVSEVWAEAFKKQEHEFIKKTHFDVMAKSLPFDVSKCSMTLQNVIWSIAVQHWPGRKEIVTKALSEIWWNLTSWNLEQEKKLIEAVYKVRTSMFPNESWRYQREQRIALAQINIFPSWNANIPDGDIQSLPVSYSANWVTECAKTARLNASRFWVTVLRWWSATEVENMYRSQWKITQNPTWKVFQVFCESLTYNWRNWNPRYWHVATWFVKDWQAYVLDPYVMWTVRPIPFERYKAHIIREWRWFNGVANVG